MKNILVAPSILAVWDKSGGNYDACLEAARQAEAAGADWIHVDVMDGRYVPAKTFGPEMVHRLKDAVKLPLDVHLMVEGPEWMLEDYKLAGADRICFHPSVCANVGAALQKITDLGMTAGLALDVNEDADWLGPYKDLVQQVLVMTVKAGAGGQPLRDDLLPKIAAVREAVGEGIHVVADGGIGPDNAATVALFGADVLVAGSAVFHAVNMNGAIEGLK